MSMKIKHKFAIVIFSYQTLGVCGGLILGAHLNLNMVAVILIGSVMVAALVGVFVNIDDVKRHLYDDRESLD